jgi:AraC family transcriptional regulator
MEASGRNDGKTTMKAALENYTARMRRVIDYIDRHLDDDLDLNTVSGVAAFSKFHFHRQFTATFQVSVHRYVQLARLKRASHRLATETPSVTEVAMGAGYDAPDAFARAFRQRLGQSPSSFQASPDWARWLEAFGTLENARSMLMQIKFESGDVEIRDVPPTPVAIMSHRGDRATLGDTIQRFREWRKEAGLSPETSPTFMIFRSERTPADPSDYGVDICAGTDRPIKPNDGRVTAGQIPGGRCAVLRYPGNTNNLEPASLYLYRNWLPASGEEARDFPHYSRRHLWFNPDVSAHEVVVEVYLPLK